MSEGDKVEVYRTGQRGDAEFIQGLLEENGIACELRGSNEGGDEEILDLALVVAPADEERAVTLIAAQLEGQGFRPHEGTTGGIEDTPCPNCARAGLTLGDDCPECEYCVLPPPDEPFVRARAALPDAKAFCSDCCAPSVLPSGACPDCGGELEPLHSGDLLCPKQAHVLVKGEGEGLVCPGCRSGFPDSRGRRRIDL